MITEKKEKWDMPSVPRLVPEAIWSNETDTTVLCLDGEWEIVAEGEWNGRKITVPSDTVTLRRQGFPQHYEYRRTISLPETSESARFVLKFEGVNAFVDVYVDDVHVASHKNGFLTWNVEITGQVKGKREVELRVAADEGTDRVSSYSHGGILHSVYLYILPPVYVEALYLSPLFDEDMETCSLRVDMGMAGMEEKSKYEAEFTLYGPVCIGAGISPGEQGMGNQVFKVRKKLEACIDTYYTFSLPVENPVLWDAEHPNLYFLQADIFCDGVHMESVKKQTGLRRLTRKGNRLFVNHNEVKLRGACRHEISPEDGRALTRELIELDVLRFKEANCNYIRTSHYPPSEYFLELCDVYGIYVEDELALAFIARTLPYTQRDPEETARYISHFTECLARDYNHPSVIIWSLCNESFGGHNFDLLNRYVHKKDPTRMTKFSYPMTIREEHELPDIWSIHYSEYDADLARKHDNLSLGHSPGRDLPVLHDEYVHVCCYNRTEMRRDPAVHSFWGESIRIFWDNIWNTEGALGGAIWAGIDETDVYRGGGTQLEWGIIDVWRRRKPEFYMTRKAYSPVKVLHHELLEDGRMVLIIQNRFCHTDLSEVSLKWEKGRSKGCALLPKAKPGMTVRAIIDTKEKMADEKYVHLSFVDSYGFCVDEMRLLADKNQEMLLADVWQDSPEDLSGKRSIQIQRDADATRLTGKEFRVVFDNKTGLLTGLWLQDKQVLVGGPFLNVPYLKLGEWRADSFEALEEENCVRVVTTGEYRDSLAVEWQIVVWENGEIHTKYRILRVDKYLPKNLKLRVGVDRGGLDELGVAYLAAPSLDTLSWKRTPDICEEGVYTWYPEDHISRNVGMAERFPADGVWEREPGIPWGRDIKRHILNGKYDVEYKGSNDFRSTKEDVSEAYLYSAETEAGIGIRSLDEKVHVRLEVVDPEEWKVSGHDPRVRYSGTWYSQEDKKESDSGREMWSREKGATATLAFNGTGVVWYGPQDTTLGMANVYIDGKLVAEKISQRAGGCDFSCSSVGYDKKYHLPVFSVTGLPEGEHTICVEVCGEKQYDASDYYIILDYFRVLTGERTEPIRLMLNQDFAYPHLSWGNYTKSPILLEEGTEGCVCMKAVCVNTEFLQRQIASEI